MKYRVIYNFAFYKAGFTLVELMLVVSLMVLLGVLVFPISVSFYQTQIINDVQAGLTASLRESQMLAISGKDDSSFGVYLQDGSYTLFTGESYLGRDENKDEIVSIAPNVSVDGPTEIIFSQLTGLPNVSETVVLSFGNKTRQIEIMPSGNID